jgi:hypothetical protein
MNNYRFNPWTKRAGWNVTKGWFLALRAGTLAEEDHRDHDRGEPSSYQKIVRPFIRSSSTVKDDRSALKTSPSPRGNGSRVCTVEERMSREVETFM